jgi:hypothetical protein
MPAQRLQVARVSLAEHVRSDPVAFRNPPQQQVLGSDVMMMRRLASATLSTIARLAIGAEANHAPITGGNYVAVVDGSPECSAVSCIAEDPPRGAIAGRSTATRMAPLVPMKQATPLGLTAPTRR